MIFRLFPFQILQKKASIARSGLFLFLVLAGQKTCRRRVSSQKTLTSDCDFLGHPARAVQFALRLGKTQSPNVLCFIDQEGWKIREITLGMHNAVKFDAKEQLQKVALLFQNGWLVEVDRAEIRTGLFLKKFGF